MNKVEFSILGGLLDLLSHESQLRVSELLKPRHFKDETAREYYNMFLRLLQDGLVDSLRFYTACKEAGLPIVHDTGKLFTSTYTDRSLDIAVKTLIEHDYKQKIVESVEEELDSLRKSVNADEVDTAKERLIISLSTHELIENTKVMDFYAIRDKMLENMLRGNEIEGYSTGVITLDAFLNGIQVPRYIVLGALKKSGKSRFVIHLRRQLYEQGIASPFISLEMPEYEIGKLTYANFLDINDMLLRSNKSLTNSQLDRLKSLKINTSLLPTEVVTNVTVEQLISKIRKYSTMHPRSVIFIDFIQRISHDIHRSAQELERISKDIADATRRYNVSVVMLSQLANRAENEGEGIGMLKGSGGIAENADTILLMKNVYRSTKNESDRGRMEFIIEQRYGDSGLVTCEADLGRCKFFDVSYKEEIERAHSVDVGRYAKPYAEDDDEKDFDIFSNNNNN